MAAPSVTYIFDNNTTADATQVNQNFADLIDGASDGTKDYDVNQLETTGKLIVGGAFQCEGQVVTVATNGGSLTIADTTAVQTLAPAADIAGYSLTMPASPGTGQRVVISAAAFGVRVLTLAANTGHAFATGHGITALPAGTAVEYIFRSNTWYRIGGLRSTDWTSFTPTGSWNSNTTYTGYRRRVGDVLEMRVKVALSGTPAGGTLTITLPDSLSIDTTKLLGDTSKVNSLGTGWVTTNVDGIHTYLSPVYSSATAIRIYAYDIAALGLVDVQHNTPFTFASGDFLIIRAAIPVLGA